MDLFASETARYVFAAWFAFLGGAVGSFLNVVAYRLPAGLSIAWPGSHCPHCKHAIRSFDNVPVLAWLWLRGRCRDCRRPISVRYPLVEALTAGLFVLLLVVEVYGSGHNLPVRGAAADRPGYPQSQALAICVLHLGLLTTLMASALMTLDGKRPPRRLFIPVSVAGFVAATIFPWLHPQPAALGTEHYFWSGLIDSLAGLAAGYYLGRLVQWVGRRVAGFGQPGYRIGGEAVLLGIVLGWQPAVVLVLAAIVLEEVTRLAALGWPRLRRFTAAVWLPPLALVMILNWARLAALVGK